MFKNNTICGRYNIFAISVPVIIIVFFTMTLPVFPVKADTPTSSLNCEINNSLINLTVENMPLNNILESISAKTGLILKTNNHATELITCHFSGTTLAEILEKLLVNWNYALFYKNNSQGSSQPDILWIIKRNLHRPNLNIAKNKPYIKTENITEVQQDNQLTFPQEDITEIFADRQNIIGGLTVEKFISDEQITGVEITRLSSGSPLRDFDLQEEDIIFDINGQPVTNAKELVQALADSTDGRMSVIRIERQHNNEIDPIYIELH